MMGAARVAAERQRRGHHDDIWAAASAGDSRDRAEAGPTVTVHVPLEFRQRRGRKVLVVPDGAGQTTLMASPSPARTRNEVTPAVRTLARAFRWRKLLESGVHTAIEDISVAESVTASYVGRVLRLTLLSPENVVAILNGALSGDVPLSTLMKPLPLEWIWSEGCVDGERDPPRAR